MSAVARSLPSSLEMLRELTRPVSFSGERLLPVRNDLAGLLPGGGFRRGSVVEVGVSSLVFVAIAEAVKAGSWAAFVGMGSLGLAAASDCGLDFDRLAVVNTPPQDLAATVVAALVDALDFVVLASGMITQAADARRLTARARERGAVLLVQGRWPEAADIELQVIGADHQGLGEGFGYLSGWRIEVQAQGRGAAAQRRQGLITLADGSQASHAMGDNE